MIIIIFSENSSPFFFINWTRQLNVSSQSSEEVVLDLRRLVGDKQDGTTKLRFDIETNINVTDFLLSMIWKFTTHYCSFTTYVNTNKSRGCTFTKRCFPVLTSTPDTLPMNKFHNIEPAIFISLVSCVQKIPRSELDNLRESCYEVSVAVIKSHPLISPPEHSTQEELL